MKNLIITGGMGMFAILLLGAVALATAAWFAWRAEGRVRGFLDGMSRAVLYASLTALCTDVAHTLSTVKSSDPASRGALLMNGIEESLSPLILGFAILGLIHLLVALGQRRLDARRA